jgi:hypothetical protein
MICRLERRSYRLEKLHIHARSPCAANFAHAYALEFDYASNDVAGWTCLSRLQRRHLDPRPDPR